MLTMVFSIRSFLLVSVSLFRLNSSRYICVSICLMFQMTDIGSLLINAYFQSRSTSRLTAVIHQFSSTE